MTAALIPLAMFLVNETTRDIYVLPPEAAAQIEGAKPCAPFKANITATTFSNANLDQMCTSLAQSLFPKVASVMKTTWSPEHAQSVGHVIRSLQTVPNLRADVQVWPPEIPFSLAGLTSSSGMNLVFGVKTPDKAPAVLERVDVWSSTEDRFVRTYWSRSMNDPTYSSSQARIMARVGSSIQRSWKAKSGPGDKPDVLKILVDKKISEREIAVIENVVKAYSKGAGDGSIAPVEVRKDGIVYQIAVGRARQVEIVNRLNRELPTFKSLSLADGPVDISVLMAAPN